MMPALCLHGQGKWGGGVVGQPNVDRHGQGDRGPKNSQICVDILYGWPCVKSFVKCAIHYFSLCKFTNFFMSFFKSQVSFSLNFASLFSVIKDNSSVLFLGQTLNTLHNRNQLKCKFVRLLSVQVKIHQILVIFETSQFFFKFCITLQGHET